MALHTIQEFGTQKRAIKTKQLNLTSPLKNQITKTEDNHFHLKRSINYLLTNLHIPTI